MQRHAQRADAAWVKPERGGQHQVRAVRLKQIGRADIGSEARGDQCHDVHQRIGWLASFFCQVGDFIESQNQDWRQSLQVIPTFVPPPFIGS